MLLYADPAIKRENSWVTCEGTKIIQNSFQTSIELNPILEIRILGFQLVPRYNWKKMSLELLCVCVFLVVFFFFFFFWGGVNAVCHTWKSYVWSYGHFFFLFTLTVFSSFSVWTFPIHEELSICKVCSMFVVSVENERGQKLLPLLLLSVLLFQPSPWLGGYSHRHWHAWRRRVTVSARIFTVGCVVQLVPGRLNLHQ